MNAKKSIEIETIGKLAQQLGNSNEKFGMTLVKETICTF